MNHYHITHRIFHRNGTFRGYVLRDQHGNTCQLLWMMRYFTTTINQNIHYPQPDGTYRMVLRGPRGFPTIIESARQFGGIFRISVWIIV